MKHKIIFWLVFLVVAVAVVFSFKSQIQKGIQGVTEKVQQFQKTDLQDFVDKVAEQISLPPPLHIGGDANNSTFSSQQIIVETNIARSANGVLPALTENAKLNAAAKAKAEDMFANQYFEHVSPGGVDPGTLVKNYGYEYIITGENLILGNFKDEKEIVQLWMNSPGHRANILNNRFVEMGAAIVKGKYKGETVWIGVQEFGLPLSACAQADVSLQQTIEANKAQLDSLAAQIDAKRTEINNTSRHSPEYNQLVDEYNALVAEYNPLNDKTKNLIAKYNGQINTFNNCVAGK